MKIVVGCAVLFAACVSPPPESKTPTITATSVDNSPIAANADGSYSFTVSFTFSDDVNVESYTWIAGAVMVTANLQTPRPTGTTKFTVMLGTGTPAGTVDYTIAITDTMSRTSPDADGSVVLDTP